MKQLLSILVLATLPSCLSAPGDQPRVGILAGTQRVTVGDLDSQQQHVIGVELESLCDEPSGLRGVLGLNVGSGSSEAYALNKAGERTEVGMRALQATAGLRWEPVEWDWQVTPRLGAGVGYLDLTHKGSTGSVDDGAAAGYWEAGATWRDLFVGYRRLGSSDFQERPFRGESRSAHVDAFVVSWSVRF